MLRYGLVLWHGYKTTECCTVVVYLSLYNNTKPVCITNCAEHKATALKYVTMSANKWLFDVR